MRCCEVSPWTSPRARAWLCWGASGVGKSTLVSILGLLIGTKKFAGTIHYADSQQTTHDYQSLPQATAEYLRRTEFGFALQDPFLLPHLTVAENLGIPLGFVGNSDEERQTRAAALLKSTPDLPDHAESLPTTLSGGQKQRVGVLRSLIHQPTVVFADEPFSALDDNNKFRILDLLVQWQEHTLGNETASGSAPVIRTLFLVCHDKAVAEKYQCDILFMDENFKIEFIKF